MDRYALDLNERNHVGSWNRVMSWKLTCFLVQWNLRALHDETHNFLCLMITPYNTRKKEELTSSGSSSSSSSSPTVGRGVSSTEHRPGAHPISFFRSIRNTSPILQSQLLTPIQGLHEVQHFLMSLMIYQFRTKPLRTCCEFQFLDPLLIPRAVNHSLYMNSSFQITLNILQMHTCCLSSKFSWVLHD